MTQPLEDKLLKRDIVLDILKRQRGEWVSGQILAQRLSMSRAAIWKHIGLLKKQGYRIDASPRKGYRLENIPDLLLTAEIRDGLKTRIIGQTDICHFEQIDSTNRQAKALAAAGAPEGALVVAEEQSHGRGRRDRYWFSPRGKGVYASLIIRPAVSSDVMTHIVILTAVAMAETLRATTGLHATIKWPNDILVRDKKIAGILTEIAMEMDVIDYMIIGLGLNVNHSARDFPDDIRESATSVFIETGRSFPRVFLLRHFLEIFEAYYEIFLNAGFNTIMAKWRTLTDMMGKQVSVQTVGGSHRGVITDFDAEGFMILTDAEGHLSRIISGDVTIMG